MRQVVTTVQYVFAGIGGFMGWFLGGLDGFLYALLMFVVIDYATGLMAAFVQKKVSSEVGFKGICKKVAIFCLVGIGHVLDTQVIQNGIGVDIVRALYGVQTAERANKAIIVTSSYFTEDAQRFAEQQKTLIDLFDIDDLIRLMENSIQNEQGNF